MRHMPLLISSIVLGYVSPQARSADFSQESRSWETPLRLEIYEHAKSWAPAPCTTEFRQSDARREQTHPVKLWQFEKEQAWVDSLKPAASSHSPVAFERDTNSAASRFDGRWLSRPLREPLPDVSNLVPENPYAWQFLPVGILYKSYIAGPKESRFATTWFRSPRDHTVWDSVLGGKMGLVRYGNRDPFNPRGWQFDLEGAVFTRLDPNNRTDLDAADYRIALPFSWRNEQWQLKWGYYHISSHVGDEFLARHPDFIRDNYVREAFQFGVGYFIKPDLRTYAEAGYALKSSGAADKWEVQFGIDYSPWIQESSGGPFAAVNTYFREEIQWGAGVSMATGWQWISKGSGAVLRFGAHSYLGRIYQFSFVRDRNQYEKLLGLGLSYDF